MKGANKALEKGKPTTVIDRSRVADMNMAVLKRIDPHTEEILATAGHVCLYRMSVADQQWQRKNIEGSLFLIKRRATPRFQMIVLNKLSTDNYIESIHGGLEIEMNPPYLMYTHGNDEIHGIWFYEVADLERLGNILNKILAQLPKPEVAPPSEVPAVVPSPAPAAAATAAAGGGSGGGGGGHVAAPPAAAAPARSQGGDDAFWDRSVHVTEETLAGGQQQLVPNSSLLGANEVPRNTSISSSGGSMGLQSLLQQAQQKHADARRAASGFPVQPAPAPPQPPPLAAAPAPADSPPAASAPPGSAAPASASKPALLTPSFFQQQLAAAAKQPATPPSGSGGGAAPLPPSSAATANGTPLTGENPLQKLLSRATRQATPTQESSRKGAGAAVAGSALSPGPSPFGTVAGGPAAGEQQATRERVRTALTRLVQNDAFVDMLTAEFKAAGLL